MKYLSILFLFVGYITYGQAFPQLSPKSKVQQKVGLCNIEIIYSRPSVKDRKVFGDLVPFGEVWRLGANECTTISINQPIQINDNNLDTGKYALFVLPEDENHWKIILNSDFSQWGSMGYDQKKNVLETDIDVSSKDCYFTETLYIGVEDITLYGANIVIRWENTQASIPISIDTDQQVDQLIDSAIEEGKELEKVHYRAASYFYKNMKGKEDLDKALMHVEKSLALDKGYYNVFMKAQILAEQGNLKEAKKLGEEAKEMAIKADKKDWADYMQEKMDEWTK